MKKLFLSIAMIGITAVMSAQIADSPSVFSDNNISILPGKYTSKGKPLLVFEAENDDNSYSFNVFDGDLNEIISFSTPIPTTDEMDSYEQMGLLSEYNDDTYLKITQAFFNSDDKFEYCVPVGREVNGNGRSFELTGFDVYSHDGSIVRQFRIPAGYSAEWCTLLNAMTLNDINYLVIEKIKKDDEYFTLIYRADGEGSAGAPLLIQKSSSVSPTAPQRGQTVRVDLGVEAQHGCFVSVINSQGREVNHIGVAEGSNSTEIRTDRLDRGVYVVVVKNGDQKQEVTKIIVR